MDIQDVLPGDAIPSIDDPSFGTAYFGDTDDEVIVVDGDPPRAYPVRILSYHEIVNDVLGSDVRSETGTRSSDVTATGTENERRQPGRCRYLQRSGVGTTRSIRPGRPQLRGFRAPSPASRR